MKKGIIRLITILSLILFCFGVVNVGYSELIEPPPLPDAYYGNITLNGNPAPEGMVIRAKIEDKVVGSIGIKQAGEYGGSEALDTKLLIQGTSKDIGKVVSFEINGVVCDQKVVYKSGVVARLDLTATGTPQTIDTQKPFVVSTNPQSGATGVNVSGLTISVRFNESIMQGDNYSNIYVADDSNNKVTISKSISNDTLIILIQTTLGYNRTYKVFIPHGAIKDLAGNIMGTDFTMTFATAVQPSQQGGTTGVTTGGTSGSGSTTVTQPTTGEATAPSKEEGKQKGKEEGTQTTKRGEANIVEKNILPDKANDIEIKDVAKISIAKGAIKGENAKVVLKALDEKDITTIEGKKMVSKPIELRFENCEVLDKIRVEIPVEKENVKDDDVIEAYMIDEKGKSVKLSIDLPTSKDKVTFDTNLSSLKVIIVSTPVDSLYKDVKESWAKRPISYMTSKGIITGYPDSSFRPKNEVTRKEVAAIITRMLKIEAKEDLTKNFADSTKIPSWASEAVSACAQAGILVGAKSADGSVYFKPDAKISRAELAVVVSRILKSRLKNVQKADIEFKDKDNIPSWAKEDIAIVASYKIITGYTDNSFRPDKSATREEACTMLMRLIELLEKQS